MATYNGSCSPATSACYPVISATVSASSGSSGTVTCSYTLQWYSTGSLNWGANTTSTLTLTCNGKTATNNTHASTAINVSGSGTKNLVSGSLTVTGVGSGSKSWSLVWKRPTMNVWYGSTNVKSFSCTASGTISVPAATTSCTAPTNLKVSSTSVYPGDKVTLSWTHGNGGTNNARSRYYLQYSKDGGSSWNAVTTDGAGNYNPTGTSLTTDVYPRTSNGSGTIIYQIRTEGTAGSSYYSGYVRFPTVTVNSIGTTAQIRYVRSEENGASGVFDYLVDRKISMNWDAVPGATSYEVKLMRPNTTTGATTGYTDYSTYTTSTNSITINLPIRATFPGPYIWSAGDLKGYRFYVCVRAKRNNIYGNWAGNNHAMWRSATTRIFDGSSWRNGAVYIYVNGWKLAKEIWIYNGSAWKRATRY